MGSSKKNKDKDKRREEKKKKKHSHRERSKSRDPERPEKEKHKHRHRHHHKHKRRHSKKSRTDKSQSPAFPPSHSPSLSDITISDDDLSPKEDLYQYSKGTEYVEAPSPPVIPSYERVVDSSPPRPKAVPHERKQHHHHAPPPPSRSPEPKSPPPPVGPPSGSGNDTSLSIEETNKIRIKLGLKPLQMTEAPKLDEENTGPAAEENFFKDSYGEFFHKPATNIRDKLEVEKLREKIAAQREKRKHKEKFSKMKTLGESDEENDSALAWVNKSRKLHKERLEAEKKNKMLEELDAQFGIGDLVDEEISQQKKKSYAAGNLSGLIVQHDITRFDGGGTTILTLKDTSILEGEEDTLVNVNLIDTERFERNVKRKKAKPDDPEYEAPEVDEFGKIVQNTVLTKYDDEIKGERMSSFRLGERGRAMLGSNLALGGPARKMAKLKSLQSLDTPEFQLATEYLTPSEMVSFKKVKKKKKKKKFTADDLQPLDNEDSTSNFYSGSRQSRIDAMIAAEHADSEDVNGEVVKVISKVKSLKELMEEDDEDSVVNMDIEDVTVPGQDESDNENDHIELHEALSRTRRAKVNQLFQPSSEMISDFIQKNKPPPKIENDDDDNDDQTEEDNLYMTLNTTDEFCRTLGEIPTYGLSGNRAEDDTTMLQLSPPKKSDANEARGAWEEVDIEDTRVEITDEMTQPILEEEPDASKGVGNALKLAIKKGYLEKDNTKNAANAALQHLRAIHYSIEDKAMDDDRRGRGDRYMGPTTDFREKNNYRPDVKLEYVDDEGRKLNSKEAFRYLSHKFHGKGSGKNKLEKRMKKWHEELLMKHMSSSDTPLQTLERQREKQKQLGSAYLVLSGNKTQEPMDVKK